ncbi:NAD(P)-dependent oxidoreductase [Gordonia sp. KTR9]|uniref:NAD(P)-dependent oxidoreductase n=1 Tax=Gordonia sp. KTR9 TaxID=337191 RepID=UPI00027DDF4E|nr:NAD(P)-dependent oxidoreductase [Gordonia sp. KTR9]AFR49494.1 3-hydroxyisobutyrate dehydrogenase-related beta-hydroxyacid dehydrogenase [Gordonia sp. KTR9]
MSGQPLSPGTTPAAGPHVGFIGAGSMGTPMIHRLLDRQVPVTVSVRRREVAEELTAAGAHVVDTPAAATRGRELVVVCLFDEPQLEDVVLGDDGVAVHLDAGATLVIHTTAGPRLISAIADAAARRGARVVDAPISGSATDIREGRLTVLAGGDPDAVDTAERTVTAYSGRYLPTGGLGTASTIKLINNLLFTANVQMVAEAARIGQDLGVDPAVLLSTVNQCSGASDAMRRMSAERSVAAFGERVGKYLSKDSDSALTLAASLGVETRLFGHVVVEGPLDLGVTAAR